MTSIDKRFLQEKINENNTYVEHPSFQVSEFLKNKGFYLKPEGQKYTVREPKNYLDLYVREAEIIQRKKKSKQIVEYPHIGYVTFCGERNHYEDSWFIQIYNSAYIGELKKLANQLNEEYKIPIIVYRG